MLFRLFKRNSPNEIVVVSGLPRSGTSMMMRMLEAGGLPVLVDHIRIPDESNPKGYYELERVKQLQDGNTAWVAEGRGKVIKVISALLQYLPPEHQYRVVFMERNMGEILASQREMLIRRSEPTDRVDDSQLAALYQKHLAQVTEWLARQPNMQAIHVHYNQILENPHPPMTRLCSFLKPFSLDSAQMLGVIEASLYRQRAMPAEQAMQQT